MASNTLQSLFRESKNRATDRGTFVQVLTRLSSCKAPKDGDAGRKRDKEATEKAA